MSDLTIAYMTCRRDPMIHWFFESLDYQDPDMTARVIVVDFWKQERWLDFGKHSARIDYHVLPKPNVWNGMHRLTKENWFAAANQRNTALCLCRTPWIAYVDDLSVLMPGWFNAVKQAMHRDGVTLGAYMKYNNLEVHGGKVVGGTPHSKDTRSSLNGPAVPCAGSWMYGCSLVGTVERFLNVNGWPEDVCDGLGGEDTHMGIVMGNYGCGFWYDPSMLTIESEERHFAEKAFRREDWHFESGVPVVGGNGRDDKSHAALNMATGSKTNSNNLGAENIRALRDSVQAGGAFPVRSTPEHDWYTKLRLDSL